MFYLVLYLYFFQKKVTLFDAFSTLTFSMFLTLEWLLNAQIPVLDKPTSFLHNLRFALRLLLGSVILQKNSTLSTIMLGNMLY